MDFITYSLHNVNNWGFALCIILILQPGLLTDKGPQPVQIDTGAPLRVFAQMVVPHAQFTEITGMVFVEIDAMVMHTTGVTATSRVLAVFTYVRYMLLDHTFMNKSSKS